MCSFIGAAGATPDDSPEELARDSLATVD